MNINKTSNQNFGWSLRTHYRLTKSIAENIPILKKYATTLAISSLSPDIKLSQSSLGYNMAHCFAGKDFNSYDIVPVNASDFYFDNLSKALCYLKDKHNFLGMIRAGNALHFLQDMTVPLHTHPDCFTVSKFFQHIKYERIPNNNPSLLQTVLKSEPPQISKDFCDCFLSAYEKSAQMENPYKIPQEQWAASVQESLENAYENTYMFLKRLAWLKDVPPDKRSEVFRNEAFTNFISIKQAD